MYRDHLVSLLKRNVKPALGCTEPAAIALAVSRAQEESRGDIRDVRVRLSGNIFKNARGVGIPGTSEYGIEFAVALALACGDGLDLQRHQGLAAQLAARGTGVVGFQGALAGLALGIQGFKGKGGHARIDLTGEGLVQMVATNDVSTSAFERASPA